MPLILTEEHSLMKAAADGFVTRCLRRASGLLGAVVAYLLTTSVASACDSVGYRSAAAQLADTDVVFVGRAGATASEPGAPTDDSGYPLWGRGEVTTFEVIRLVKGSRVSVVEIYHESDERSDCGVEYVPGKEYLILAQYYQGRLTASILSEARFSLAQYLAASRP